MAGGKQDQYAATFGVINFMEFYEGNNVIVNPLLIRSELKNELEFNLILYYTQTSRESAKIIESQAELGKGKIDKPIIATHIVKKQAFIMKEAL